MNAINEVAKKSGCMPVTIASNLDSHLAPVKDPAVSEYIADKGLQILCLNHRTNTDRWHMQ